MRKNRSLQTKIGQFLRKNKMDLLGTIPQLSDLTAEEESQERKSEPHPSIPILFICNFLIRWFNRS